MVAISSPSLSLPWPTTGGPRAVLEASATSVQRGEPAVLAVVVETEGSTYARIGSLALFGSSVGQVGWLSGGCLEPEFEHEARRAALGGQLRWLDIDTRQDEDLMSGTAVGCRGRVCVALVPLPPEWARLVTLWRHSRAALELTIERGGDVTASLGRDRLCWSLRPAQTAGTGDDLRWHVAVAPPRKLLVFGAGPEAPLLMPLLRSLGWMTTLVERRARWQSLATLADTALVLTPEDALTQLRAVCFDAALVMHHDFERDREALAALAHHRIDFIGLLGPTRRREDLFRILPADARATLWPRLRSPVGLPLGGHGSEAIALSIAAQLQQHGCRT